MSPALKLMDTLANYLHARFSAETKDPFAAAPILPPIDLSVQIVLQADRIVDALVAAYRNPLVLAGFDPMREVGDVSKLSPAQWAPAGSSAYVDVSSPAMLVNERGYIIAWYLPQVVSTVNQEAAWDSCRILRQTLRKSVSASTRGDNWRNAQANFRQDANLMGCINMSPAWYQQGHNKNTSELEVSASLKVERNAREGQNWLEKVYNLQMLMSASMRIMHPDMYGLAREAMGRLWATRERENNEDMTNSLALWPSVFNSLSLMVNRCSPHHLDKNGLPQWFDQLLTVGTYRDLYLDLPRQGLRLHYLPGTMVAFSGRLLPHGVAEVGEDRACISWYMQDKVHHAMGVPRCNYAEVRNLFR